MSKLEQQVTNKGYYIKYSMQRDKYDVRIIDAKDNVVLVAYNQESVEAALEKLIDLI